MGEVMNYHVVEASSMQDLRSHVNSWVRLGFIPVGGPLRVRQGLFSHIWYQGVLRSTLQGDYL